MTKIIVKGFGMVLVLTVVLFLSIPQSGSNTLLAQEYTGPHEIKWIRVGDLRQWYTNAGMEVEYGLIPRAMAQSTQQADEMMWEALYYRTDTQCSRGLWIGAVNFTDPISGVTYPFKVVQAGPRFLNTLTNFIPTVFRMTGRFRSPLVAVDGADGTDNTLDDVVEEVVANQPADRILVNVTRTNIGIECKRTIYGSSQQNHDDYHIYEFVFKNTGVVDAGGTKVDQTLTGVIFNFINRYAPGHPGYLGGWSPTGNVSWGRNTVYEVIGQNPADPQFEMRATYAWYGPNSQSPLGYEADWGEPNTLYAGPLGAPGFCGVVTLYADKSSNDRTDDPAQPKHTQWWDSDANIMNNIDSYNMSQMTEQYAAMSAGHPSATHAALVGDGFADQWGPGIGGLCQMLGYGPYTLAPGDSVRIVMAEGVAGLTRRKSIEVGTQWFNDTRPFTMSDGTQTNDRNAYKRDWVWTAEDSIMDMFRRAVKRFDVMERYRKGLVQEDALCEPPPPPESFNVSSRGDRIVLEWGGNADSWPTFNGYQIYRAVDRPDALYDLLFSCDKNDVVHRYDDTSARRGFSYFYYLVTMDDGSRNDIFPGVPLMSSKFYTLTNRPAYLMSIVDVYPGDTDNNGVVNALDVLPVGVYFLTKTPSRDTTGFSWSSHQTVSWGPATCADANGDGIVDERDVIGIGVNWGATHEVRGPSYPVDFDKTALSSTHRRAFETIYRSLSGNGPAAREMKTLLAGILGDETPREFSLEQNYPNPFNPKTEIRFSLPENQRVTLTVYDLLGREVKVLMRHRSLEAGTHAVSFNACDLASGMYVCRIATEKWSAFRKMVIAK